MIDFNELRTEAEKERDTLQTKLYAIPGAQGEQSE